MNKPQSLRNALNSALPEISQHPDRLNMSVENGALVASQAGPMSWEYRYQLNVTVDSFSGELDWLMATVQLWLNASQPDALNHPQLREKLFTFAIDAQGAIRLCLQLSEPVRVNGNVSPAQVAAQPEPPPAEERWTVRQPPATAHFSPRDRGLR
ncbi:phage tail protein [Erwinia piriflorinigrans]|uniref:phage tail protein n=1 Tax=Erwinia piriflorinigrans TaxID=665097 RepID=UPI00065F75B6|nr:phage tail protein [Erwinia piriflorinigrans]